MVAQDALGRRRRGRPLPVRGVDRDQLRVRRIGQAAADADANASKIIDVWQPIAKTWAAPGGAALFANVSTVDSTPPTTTFAQNVISLRQDPKTALTTLQTTLTANLKS